MKKETRDLRDLSPDELNQWLLSKGHERYRADQVLEWLYRRKVVSLAEMKNLPGALRQDLAREFSLSRPRLLKTLSARDGTEKYLFEFADGERIETVWIPEGERGTVCLSTQAGCKMACRFCRTGEGGFRRPLAPSEIVGQILDLPRPIGNLVLMGMGEPLDNLDSVAKALTLIGDRRGLGFSPKRVTLSTLGLIEGIKKLPALAPLVNLAVSLHSVVPETRKKLLPRGREILLPKLKAALKAYQKKLKEPITIEIVLVAGVNDTPAEAKALAHWLADLSAKVNLIAFNPFPESDLAAPTREAVLAYQDVLREKGIKAFIRQSKGQDILAACGQLRGEK